MKCIKTFSNKFAPTKFAPEVTANNRTISILPHSIFFEEKEYAFHDAVDIDVPELTDDVSLKVYFVEDMSNNEIIYYLKRYDFSNPEYNNKIDIYLNLKINCIVYIMSSDTKSKIIRRNNKSKKMDELSRRRKKNEQSDDSDNNFSSDSESDEMDAVEYQKFLSTMFPSKHLNKKIKAEKVPLFYNYLISNFIIKDIIVFTNQ